MSLYVARCPGGLTITAGTKPKDIIATFPGLGKHLVRVKKHLPYPNNGVYDVSPLAALTAISRCLQPLQRCELADAFRSCLIVVDRQNAEDPAFIEAWAEEFSGWNTREFILRVGLAKFRHPEYTNAYKLVKGTKSYWVRINIFEAGHLRQVVIDDTHPPPPISDYESSSTGSD